MYTKMDAKKDECFWGLLLIVYFNVTQFILILIFNNKQHYLLLIFTCTKHNSFQWFVLNWINVDIDIAQLVIFTYSILSPHNIIQRSV